MERFLRATELENQSQISLEILDSRKTVYSLHHQMTDNRQDNAWQADLRLSFRLFC